MLRFFGRLLLFLGLLLFIKSIAWWLYQPVRERLLIISDTHYKSAQFDSLRHSCQLAFVGSSRTYMSIMPRRFDSLTHPSLQSYNYGVSAFFAPHSYQFVESLLRRTDHSLRYICVELSLPSPFLHEEPFVFNPLAEVSYRARLWRHYDDLTDGPSRDSWPNRYVLDLLSPGPCLHRIRWYLQHVAGGATDQAALAEHTDDQPYDLVPSPTGYIRNKQLHPTFWRSDLVKLPYVYRLAKQMSSAHPTPAPDATYWTDIDRLLGVARARGVRLLFYLPNRPTAGEVRLLPAVFNQLPMANRLALQPGSRFDALFSPANSLNVGHLNHDGAWQYTALLAEAFSRATAHDSIPSSRKQDALLSNSVDRP